MWYIARSVALVLVQLYLPPLDVHTFFYVRYLSVSSHKMTVNLALVSASSPAFFAPFLTPEISDTPLPPHVMSLLRHLQ